MADPPLLLTIPEAAALLRIGRNTCYQLAREHKIPTVRLGRRLLVPRAGLARWLEQQAGVPTEAADMVPFPRGHGPA